MRPDIDRLVVLVLAIWLCAATGIASADAASGPESIILPSAVEGWTWDGQEAHYGARTLFDYIDGAGELYLAYGLEQLAVGRFEQADQPPLTIQCCRMESADTEYHVGVSDLHRIEVVKLGWTEDVLI